MRCQFCNRPLIASAVPGMQVGPKCAADRGLLPGRHGYRRHTHLVVVHKRSQLDPNQIDWISNAGAAGESAAP